jgi:hypothetical protein
MATTNIAGKFLPAGNGGVTYPSPNEWPVTIHAVTNITRAGVPIVTVPNHGITMSTTQSTPQVDFTQVQGMQQINGQFAFVASVIDANNITIKLDTSRYSPYTSGGWMNILVSPSPIDPLQNTFP